MRDLRVDPRAAAGAFLILLLLLVALAAGSLPLHDPLEQDLLSGLLPPAWIAGGDPTHLLGTDGLGRDLLSRLMHGARTALVVALVAASLSCLLGTALGVAAGVFGGWTDQAISRATDVWMSFPPVLLAIVLAAVVGAGLGAVVLAIVVVDWTRFARVVRAETRLQMRLDYVAAARTLGLDRRAILRLEVLPNLLPLLLTLLSAEMGIAVVVEAVMSFVGLSVAGETPTWGGMIAEGRQVMHQAPLLLAAPVGCIVATVLGFNLLGDGLRATLDPVRR